MAEQIGSMFAQAHVIDKKHNHKCPAAIGLTTFLRHEKLDFPTILMHLSAFTITSPIGAIVSYWGFKAFEVSYAEGSNTYVAVGIFLLLSAGTLCMLQ